jgi:hypothetical protein
MNTNDEIFKSNLKTVSNSLNTESKNIIYSTQYISDEDTQYDQDGPQSSWVIVFLCIEKTSDDYIFHFFQSDYLRSYSYPYLAIVNKFHPFTQKLSDLKVKGSTISERSTNEINNYIQMFNNFYSHGFKSTDQNLINLLKPFSLQIDELEGILDEKYKKEKIERDLKYEEYLKSDEYQEGVKKQKEYNERIEEEYRIKEEKRLKLWIDAHGVEKGTQYFNRL